MEQTLEDHNCPWRDKAEELSRHIEELCQRIEQLERMLFGKRSEKTLTTKIATPSDPAAAQETRALRRKSNSLLPEVRHVHEVEDEAKT